MVRDPATGEYFTPEGAWEFALLLLKIGVPLRQIGPELVTGAKRLWLEARGFEGAQIHIELQCGGSAGGLVVGRAFYELSLHAGGADG